MEQCSDLVAKSDGWNGGPAKKTTMCDGVAFPEDGLHESCQMFEVVKVCKPGFVTMLSIGIGTKIELGWATWFLYDAGVDDPELTPSRSVQQCSEEPKTRR